MTLSIFNRGIPKADASNPCRDDEMCEANASRMSMVCLVLSFCVVASPLVALAGDEPQELPKPSHMTVAPVFQEWQFDESTLNQVPKGFSLEVGGTVNKGG